MIKLLKVSLTLFHQGEDNRTRRAQWKTRISVSIKCVASQDIQGVFFHWYPPKKLKYGKPRLGESTLT